MPSKLVFCSPAQIIRKVKSKESAKLTFWPKIEAAQDKWDREIFNVSKVMYQVSYNSKNQTIEEKMTN